MSRDIYLVRHGHYESETGKLTAEGFIEAEHAGKELLSRGLDATTIVLAAELPRTIQTGEVIRRILGGRMLLGISLAALGKMRERDLKKLGEFDEIFELALRHSSNEPIASDGDSLVVVTQAPVIAAATGIPDLKVKTGSVHKLLSS